MSAFADPRCSGMIALDEQAETTTIDLEVPVEGVAREALDAFLSSDRSTGRGPIAQRSSSILGPV